MYTNLLPIALFTARLTILLFLILLSTLESRAQQGTQTITVPQKIMSGLVNLGTGFRSTSGGYTNSSGSETDGTLFLQADYSWGRIPLDATFSTRADINGRNYFRAGIHPELFNDRIQLHLGHFYADSPDLTLGDVSLLGGGMNLQLGNFRAVGNYGELGTRQPWSVQTSQEEELQRHGTEVGVGYGNDTSGLFDIRFARIADHSNTENLSANTPRNQENTFITSAFRFPAFDRKLEIQGEASIAAWNSDVNAETLDQEIPVVESIFTPRISSQFDAAAQLGVHYAPSYSFSVSVDGSWIGPGYISLAQPYLKNDVFTVSLAPTFSLLDGKLYTSGAVGIEWDNLRGTKEARTQELHGSLYSTWNAAEWITLNIAWSDYGASSDHANDTVRYGYVARSLTFSPTFYWQSFGGSNSGTITATQQSGKMRNPDGKFSESTVTGIDGVWSITFPSALSLSTHAGYSQASAESYSSDIIRFDETLSHILLKGKLIGSVTLGASRYLGSEGGTSLDFRTQLSYDMASFGRLSLFFSNSYGEGFGSNTRPTRELYGAVRYGLSF